MSVGSVGLNVQREYGEHICKGWANMEVCCGVGHRAAISLCKLDVELAYSLKVKWTNLSLLPHKQRYVYYINLLNNSGGMIADKVAEAAMDYGTAIAIVPCTNMNILGYTFEQYGP